MSYYGEQEEDTPPDEGFFNNVRKRGIAKAVDQADLGVSEGGFYRTGLIIAVLIEEIIIGWNMKRQSPRLPNVWQQLPG